MANKIWKRKDLAFSKHAPNLNMTSTIFLQHIPLYWEDDTEEKTLGISIDTNLLMYVGRETCASRWKPICQCKLPQICGSCVQTHLIGQYLSSYNAYFKISGVILSLRSTCCIKNKQQLNLFRDTYMKPNFMNYKCQELE